jgi:putative endonuclease
MSGDFSPVCRGKTPKKKNKNIVSLTMIDPITLGEMGEEMAAVYFVENGYALLHRNWRYGKLEIDIIALKNNVLHFIEVKTRQTTEFGYPEEDVSRSKVRNLMSAAEEYLIKNPGRNLIQFDILAILMEENKPVEYFLIEDVSV